MFRRLIPLSILALSAALCRADPVVYAPPAEAAEGQLPDVSEYDVWRFPPAEVLQRGADFQEAHLKWLDARMAYSQESRDSLYGYREDLKWRMEVHGAALCAARCGPRRPGGGGADPGCRFQLRELRRLIGVRRYNRGELPCCVDVRRFSRAD